MALSARERAVLRATVTRLRQRATSTVATLNARARQCATKATLLDDVTVAANAQARLVLLDRCRGDSAAQLDELQKCKGDFLYWLEFYAWTYDPRHLTLRMLPFVPFPFQRKAAAWFQDIRAKNSEGIIEKSRTIGATWLLVAYCVWCWLFEEGFSALFCSRNFDAVDVKGNASSILEKARILVRALPKWMQPEGYEESAHALHKRILNPANGSILVGEGGKEVGRSGRATIVVADEAAFWQNPAVAEAALNEVSEVIIWISTPNAPGDWFSTKRHGDGHPPVLTLHWKEDPRRNRWVALSADGKEVAEGAGEAPDPASVGARRIIWPWYEKQKARYTDPAKLAREVDIDYSASSDRVVFPSAWIRACVNLDLGDMGEVRECGGDLAGDGANSDLWTFRRGAAVVIQKVIVRPNPTATARAFFMVTESVNADVLHYDAGGGYGGAMSGEYDINTNGGKVWKFKLHAVNGGGKCSARRFGDKPARELFTNLRAEMYWTVRERFRRGYELWLWRQGDPAGVPHDPNDCISIPGDSELVGQLSSVLFIEVPSGKVQLESKKQMRERGVKSPDKADSLVLAFAPTPNPAASRTPGTVEVAA